MTSSGERRPPSGEQYEISSGTQRLIVTQVGATLRSYAVDGVDVIDGFERDERASGGSGQVLAPWPNRLDEGRYTFDGVEGRAAWDEPGRRNATHGLVRWLPWTVASRDADRVTLTVTLFPQPAYAWELELHVEYRLHAGGLTVSTRVLNRSATAAPFGLGFHPYLTVATASIDDVIVTVPARTWLPADDRMLPTGVESVDGTPMDFRSPRRLGDARIDAAFGDLVRADGVAAIQVTSPGGRDVSLWLGEPFRYVMVFTGDTLEPPSQRRRSLAIEPMTCPPNAFATGTDVVRLEPDAPWEASWGITPGRSLSTV